MTLDFLKMTTVEAEVDAGVEGSAHVERAREVCDSAASACVVSESEMCARVMSTNRSACTSCTLHRSCSSRQWSHSLRCCSL